MGVAQTAEPESKTLTDQPLDALIPPPLGPWRKLAASVLLISLAIGVTSANLTGLLYPRPFVGSSFNTGGPMVLDIERNAIGAYVEVPNLSSRDLRITNVTFDAPGAELVDVVFTSDYDRDVLRGIETQPLPVMIPTNDGLGDVNGGIWVFFRPTTCDNPVGDANGQWGFAAVTFDFGDGAFPPLSATHVVGDEVWSDNGGTTTVRLPSGEFVSGDGPLSLACEVLR